MKIKQFFFFLGSGEYQYLVFSYPSIQDEPELFDKISGRKLELALESETIVLDDYNIALTLFTDVQLREQDAAFHLIKSYLVEWAKNRLSRIHRFGHVLDEQTLSYLISGTATEHVYEKYLRAVCDLVMSETGAAGVHMILNLASLEENIDLRHPTVEKLTSLEAKGTSSAILSFNIDSQLVGKMMLYPDETSDELMSFMTHPSVAKMCGEAVGATIFAYTFLSEQRNYAENLEEIVSQKKTEINEKNHQLLKQLHHISELERTKNSMFSKIYHQLLTPLNAILGFTMYIINFKKDELDGEILNDIYNIEENTLFLLFNILDIIDYSKMLSNNIEFQYDSFSFATVNETITKIVYFMNKYFNRRTNYEAQGLTFYFRHDYKKVEQVIFSVLFYALSAKTTGESFLLTVGGNEEQVSVEMKLNAAFIEKDYFNRIETIRAHVKDPNFQHFVLEDFLLFVAMNILHDANDTLVLALDDHEAIITIRFISKEKKNEKKSD